MIRLVIVSDIRLYREGLADIIGRSSEVSVVGTAGDVEHAILTIQDSTPDVVLIDMTMVASCEAIRDIALSCPSTKIIALAVAENEDSILACAKVGIAGYVSRGASIDQLLSTVCAAMEGELHCPRHIAAILFNTMKSLPKEEASSSSTLLQPEYSKITLLTRRERQIAALLSDGFSNKQIARDLIIEVSTVKNHVHNILTKIGVHSRLQAVQLLQHKTMPD